MWPERSLEASAKVLSAAAEVLKREEELSLQCQWRATEVQKTALAVQGQGQSDTPPQASVGALSVTAEVLKREEECFFAMLTESNEFNLI